VLASRMALVSCRRVAATGRGYDSRSAQRSAAPSPTMDPRQLHHEKAGNTGGNAIIEAHSGPCVKFSHRQMSAYRRRCS